MSINGQSNGKKMPGMNLSVLGISPSEVSIHYATLPDTKLRYAKCGEGPPVIIVPATISWIEDWIPMIQMMGTKFTAYFFELPGHGKSNAFNKTFSSELVAETVESFANHLSLDRFSLMGFSFGGVLTMKALMRLETRIKQVIFISPVLTKKALRFSKLRHYMLQISICLLKHRSVREIMSKIILSETLSPVLGAFIKSFGKVETNVEMDKIFQKFTPNSLETMTYQFDEILRLKLQFVARKFLMPCYFFMSVNDTVVDFQETISEASLFFDDLRVKKFSFHYHQPPETPTFEEFLDMFQEFLLAQEEPVH